MSRFERLRTVIRGYDSDDAMILRRREVLRPLVRRGCPAMTGNTQTGREMIRSSRPPLLHLPPQPPFSIVT